MSSSVHGGHETAEVRPMISENYYTGGGRGMRGGTRKRVDDGMLPGRPQSFRYQRRPVENCSQPRTRGNGA